MPCPIQTLHAFGEHVSQEVLESLHTTMAKQRGCHCEAEVGVHILICTS